MSKVFLGGTHADSIWREKVIKGLKIDYFNPIVEDWTIECMEEEVKQRQECDFCLYVITPLMQGIYSIAEIVDDSNKRPERVVFCVLEEDIMPCGRIKTFNEKELKSLRQVKKMVAANGAIVYDTLEEVVQYLNRSK